MHKTFPRTGALVAVLAAVLIAGVSPDAHSDIPLTTTTSTDEQENEQLRTVPFLTLRNKTDSDNAEEHFGGRRSIMRAGVCELARTPLNALKPIAEKAPFHIPDEIVDVAAVRELPIEELWRRLVSNSNGASPLLYVHGFYISFERGCRRALSFKESLGLEGRFVLFSWPSDGAILNYTQDESDLYWSVYPLRNVLDDMISRFGAGTTNLVAHSLGTRGIMLALVLLAQTQKQGDTPLFNQVVLIAPDIDVGIFRQYLPLIRPLVRNLTVYVSSNDNPLALSRQLHGYPRLGEAGSHLDGLSGIDIIDLSNIPIRSPSGHVYHLYQSLMTRDLDQLINEGKPATQRENLRQVDKNRWQLHRAGDK
ncbi:MAG: alpha/beta hydrolase [Gammaproteobacteria bacterium]|jgi:esterase/lipase superfamily enzyme